MLSEGGDSILYLQREQTISPCVSELLYLIARYFEWESTQMPSAAWELLDTARDSDIDKCALARSLLAASKRLSAGFFLANRFDSTTRSKHLGEATGDVSSSCRLGIFTDEINP